jgi:hypothetical protein
LWKEQLDFPLLYLIHKKQKIHSLVPEFTPSFCWWSVLLIFLALCVVFFALFVFVLCIVYPMLPVSLDFPFLIAPSVFDNVYLHKCPCKYRYIAVLAKWHIVLVLYLATFQQHLPREYVSLSWYIVQRLWFLSHLPL